jgi:hypothetical protein
MTRSTFIRTAVLPAAAILAISGSAAASASVLKQHGYTYAMHLSATSGEIGAGGTTTTTITFQASRRLYGAPVNLTAIGLPSGVTASFAPARPRVGGTSTMTLTAAPSSATGVFAVTVSAIVDRQSTDPIGTTAVYDLTVRG